LNDTILRFLGCFMLEFKFITEEDVTFN